MKISTKTHVIYLKRKLKTYEIQIQVEKVWFVTKKLKNLILNFSFQRGDPLMSEWSKKNFSVFQNFKSFFWKMASMGRGKCWKKQIHEIWAHLEHPLRNHERSSTRGGSVNHPPCKIGLNRIIHPLLKFISNAFSINSFGNQILVLLKKLV